MFPQTITTHSGCRGPVIQLSIRPLTLIYIPFPLHLLLFVRPVVVSPCYVLFSLRLSVIAGRRGSFVERFSYFNDKRTMLLTNMAAISLLAIAERARSYPACNCAVFGVPTRGMAAVKFLSSYRLKLLGNSAQMRVFSPGSVCFRPFDRNILLALSKRLHLQILCTIANASLTFRLATVFLTFFFNRRVISWKNSNMPFFPASCSTTARQTQCCEGVALSALHRSVRCCSPLFADFPSK